MTNCPPIAFIIFNRPDCTRKVFERIRDARPKQLYLIADGPRNKPGEAEKCAETRRVVEGMIDWDCTVSKNYSETNMGCGKRLPSGLSHLFTEVDRAIILEDDIVPHPSFFLFCASMLKRYENNDEIMQVGAYNRFQQAPSKELDYFYSRFSDIWGWATWKRAWDKFDSFGPEQWHSLKNQGDFKKLCFSEREAEMREFCLDQIFSGQLNAWGMRWDTTKLINRGMGVIPSKNLAKNVGFGADASHTINPLNPQRFIKTYAIESPYIGPKQINSDPAFDAKYNKKMFPNNVNIEKFRTGILKLLGKK